MSATVAPSRAPPARRARGRSAARDRRRALPRRGPDPPPAAGRHPADGVGELLGGGVLHHEAERAGLHRPAQVARPAERRQDQHAARRHSLGAARRRRRARRAPGISMSSNATSGRLARAAATHLVAAARPRRRPSKSSSSSSSAARARAHQRLVVGQRAAGMRHDAPARRVRPAARQPERVAAPPDGPASDACRPPPPPARRRPVRPLPARAPARRRRRRRSRRQSGRPRSCTCVRAGVAHHVGDALAHDPPEQLARSAGHRRSIERGQSTPRCRRRAGPRWAVASSPASVTSR